MDFSCLEKLNKELSFIKLINPEDLLKKLNDKAGSDIYEYFDYKNIIKLKSFVSEDYVKSIGLNDIVYLYSPKIESLFPIKIERSDTSFIINKYFIAPYNISVSRNEDLLLRKEYLTWYINDLKNNSKSHLKMLTMSQNYYNDRLSNEPCDYQHEFDMYVGGWGYVSKDELLKNNVCFIDLPIYPGPYTKSFIVGKEYVKNLKYAHDILKLGPFDYAEANEAKECNDIYFLSSLLLDKYKIQRLDYRTLINIMPHVLDEFNLKHDRDTIKTQIKLIEDEKTFIKQLREENNFNDAICFINNVINI